ncbi:MAG: hypothetical protein GQ526_06955 [Ardenticatenales bacterium]|nr:hypothetical protein [Ardenticatenales bacterium]
MRRLMYWIGLLLVFLLMAGLACSIGGEEEPTSTPIPPTATPVPPTATPEPPAEEVDTASQPADMVSAESQARGVRLSHPEDWFYTDAGFIILLSTAADADTFVETEELPDGVTMFVMAGPADQVEAEEFSPDILGEMAEEFGAGGDVELVGSPVETTINGVPVQLMEFRAAEGSDTIHGLVALFNNGQRAAVVVAVSPEGLWDEHANTVDAILESIELFEGAGFDTGTPPASTMEPKPVEEVDTDSQPGDMVSAESEVSGVRLSHPEDWFYTDAGFLILLSSAAEVDPFGGTEEMPDGVTMFVMAGPADDMEVDEFSPDMLGEMAEDFGASGDVELVGAPVETTINGVPVQLIEFRAADGSDTIHGLFALFSNGEQAAIVVAVSPEELWDEHANTVDAILESIELFEGAGFGFDITPPAEGEWRSYLVYGDLVADEFAGGDPHLWTFDGAAGEYVTVILTPLGEGMDVTLQLLDPDGTVLIDVDDAFAGEAEVLVNYELPADGEYSLLVEEFFDEPGEYELELLGGDASVGAIVPPGVTEMGEITIGEQVEATLAEAEEHAWIIVASGGEVVDIILTPGEGQDVTLLVIAPDGSTPVDELDNGFSGEAETVAGLLLEIAGEYLVVVDEYWDVAGDYALVVDFGEEGSEYERIEMGDIAHDEVWQGTLPEGKYLHEWLFEGAAGDVVSIAVTPLTDDADLQLALIDPDGEFLFDLDEAGSDEPEMIAEYELLTTGTHSILVSDWWEAYAEYELSLTID